ncbi:MAG: hypothetical protein WC343_12430 [Bacilli bacterium]
MSMGYQISEDGKCEWRNNGGVIERRFLYATNPKWETVANTPETPRTADELREMCKKGGFKYRAAEALIIRKVPSDLKRAFKVKCAEKGISLQAAAIELMRRWVEEK